MGKLYRETKKEQGGTGANQHTEQSGNNYHSAKTEDRIAEQFNVSDRRPRLHTAPKSGDLISPWLLTPTAEERSGNRRYGGVQKRLFGVIILLDLSLVEEDAVNTTT